MTITDTVRLADLVARVRIAEIYPARCNTPSGAPPRPEDYEWPGDFVEATRRVTPVRLEVEKIYGARSGQELPAGLLIALWSEPDAVESSITTAGSAEFMFLSPSEARVGMEAVVIGILLQPLPRRTIDPWVEALRGLAVAAEERTGAYHVGLQPWDWYAISDTQATSKHDGTTMTLSELEAIISEEARRLALQRVRPTPDPAMWTAVAMATPEPTWTPEPTETYVDPIFTAEEAIARSLAEFPPNVTPEEPIARLVTHATIFRWTNSGPDGWWNPEHPVWIVGIRGTGLTVDLMNAKAAGSISAINDPRPIEGIFWAWDANSGLNAAHGALMTIPGSTRTYERLRLLEEENVTIVPATEYP